MTLSQIVKDFRTEHGLSQRQFSAMCNMSTGYVSMLEEGVNPRTKEPLVPSLVTMKKISVAMGITLDELMGMMDGDELVSLNEKDEPALKSEPERELFAKLFMTLTPENRKRILDLMQVLVEGQAQNGAPRE